jgi:uncharacterized protein (TIGR01777 family)
MKIIIAGGTGFIGQRIVDRLVGEKQKCVLVTRNPGRVKDFHKGLLRVERWDEHALSIPSELIEDGDAIINLTGESLAAGRWTPERKKRLVHSRTAPTNAIVKMIAKGVKKPSVFINASAVGYYGHVAEAEVMEGSARGNDFLASLVGQWESDALEAATFGVRVVLLRTGVVLGKKGGALPKLMLPFKFYVGGWLGSGKQWFPWVHLDDAVEIIFTLIKNPRISGPVNVVAPEPVTMKEFCLTLGKAMKRPCWAHVPSAILRLALGDMAAMLLNGQKVIPRVLQESEYRFKYPSLEKALQSIVSSRD